MSWKEICWNIVNSLLAGALVFGGGLIGTNGHLDTAIILASAITAFIAIITKFAEYWKKEEEEWSDKSSNNKLFSFLPAC